MRDLAKAIRRGEPMIWFTGSALGVSILMIVGLVIVILVNGLAFFWPQPLERITLKDGAVVMGEVVQREAIPNPGHPDHLQKHRILLRVGNRDLYGFDFKWVDEAEIEAREQPADAYFVERREYGPLLAIPLSVKEGDKRRRRGFRRRGAGPARARQEGVARPRGDRAHREGRDRRDQLPHRAGPPSGAQAGSRSSREPRPRSLRASGRELERTTAREHERFEQKTRELQALMERVATTYVVFRSADGREKELRSLDIYRAYPANRLSPLGRLGIYAGRLWEFVRGNPRESNTEGGIFPAIFGTVMMVFLMSLVVVPLGVLAALYLREYAQAGPARAHGAHRGEQPGRRALDRLRRLRAGLLRLLRGRRHRPAVLPRGAADARPSAPAASSGPR